MSNAFVSSIELQPSKDKIKLEILLWGMLFYVLYLFLHVLFILPLFAALILFLKLGFFTSNTPGIVGILFHGQRFYIIDSLGRKAACHDFKILFQSRFVLLCAYQKAGVSFKKQVIFVDQLPCHGLQQLYQACALQD